MKIHRAKSVILKLIYKVLPKVNSKYDSSKSSREEIVILNFDSLGDNILFSSVIKSVRKSYPNARIYLVIKRTNIELYANCPELNEVKIPKVIDFFGIQLQDISTKIWVYFWLLFRFKGKVSKVIGPSWLMFDNQNDISNNFYQRICPRDLAFMSESDWKVVNNSHQVLRMACIARIYGVEQSETTLSNWLKSTQIKEEPKTKDKKIVIALGAGHPNRQYGTNNLGILVRAIKDTKEFREIFIVGLSKNVFEYERLTKFLNLEPWIINLVDKQNLAETLDVIQNSDVCISNDSGIAHLASTVRKPVLVISSHAQNMKPWYLHSPERYHPWNTPHVVLQPKSSLPGCEKTCIASTPHCIDQISPTEIIQALAIVISRKEKNLIDTEENNLS
jgi:heptosyltransferase I